MHDDVANGISVCIECGVCDTLLIPEEADYRDVNWTQSSM